MLELLNDKTDEKSMGIKARLLSCHDLPAEEACYHHLCAKKLSLSKENLSSPPSGRKRGRPKNEIQEHLFNQLCEWIENETDLYTLTELYAKMKRLAGPENEKHVFASVQYLRKKLIEKYGEEEIGFTNMSNRSDVFYFKKKTLFDRIIHNSW